MFPEVMSMAGGKIAHPGDARRLLQYWAHGKGAADIRWGTDGDHTRCVRLVQEAIVKGGGRPLSDHEIHGFCTNVQKEAIGYAGNPGEGNRGHH